MSRRGRRGLRWPVGDHLRPQVWRRGWGSGVPEMGKPARGCWDVRWRQGGRCRGYAGSQPGNWAGGGLVVLFLRWRPGESSVLGVRDLRSWQGIEESQSWGAGWGRTSVYKAHAGRGQRVKVEPEAESQGKQPHGKGEAGAKEDHAGRCRSTRAQVVYK